MAKPSVVKELGATTLIDGNGGLGQLAALKAVEIVSVKARKFGSATVFSSQFNGHIYDRGLC